MKSFWMLVAIVGVFSVVSGAQTAGGSGSGNASVNQGQVDASAKASQTAQAAGTSANANASAQGQLKSEQKAKHESNSKSGGGNSASAGGSGTSAVLASGTALHAELTHSLDAKSAKPGDQVTAKVTEDVKSDGKVVVHKGSKLVGHVTEAQARSKGNADSRLGVVFDKAVLKSGQELSFNGAVQALAPPVSAALSAAGDESGSLGAPMPSGGGAPRSGGGGLLGGATSTVGGATSTVTGAAGGAAGSVANTTTGAVRGTTGLAGGLTAQGRLTSNSQGAIGLQGLALNSATAGSAQGSVVTSTTRNVRLDSGTQMLLKVTGTAQ
jgi:hypothetical protein